MTKNTLLVEKHSVTKPDNFRLFKTLQRLHFSGHLELLDAGGQRWEFYWSKGSIVYASGGMHAGRRWRRYLASYCSGIPIYVVAWQRDLAHVNEVDRKIGWEYALLNFWLAKGRITRPQAISVINAVVNEVLFEITGSSNFSHQIKQASFISSPIMRVDVGQAIASATTLADAWDSARLNHISPHQSPVIRKPERLQQMAGDQFYQNLNRLLNTRQTLWDLAVKMQRHILDLTLALRPFIQTGMIELVSLPDLNSPNYKPKNLTRTVESAAVPEASIACIDDSFWVQQMMRKLLTSAGYQFIGVNDELRAISTLLTKKPDLIFLDLVMPKANGYEICEQLRKVSRFRDTPIIILTGNDGYANRLRSNFAGASDFLSKPLDAERVLGAIQRHLKQQVSYSIDY